MLVVLTSHPIQYQAPLWRMLAAELGKQHTAYGMRQTEEIAKHAAEGGGVPFEVWFLTDQGVRRTEDRDFGKAFAWDVDLLAGYPHRFMELKGKWDMRKFDGIPLARPIGESLREAGATALWVEGWRFKPFWDGVSAAKKMGIPVFLRGETSDKIAEKGGLFGLVRNFALHRLFAKVDYFLAIGQASRRFYLKHGVPERKLIDAPYGVDNEFFRREADGIRHTVRGQEAGDREQDSGCKTREENSHEDAQEAGKVGKETGDGRQESAGRAESIRKEWKIPLDAKVVMFCGKFVGKKRPLDVVEAAALRMRHTADGKRTEENSREDAQEAGSVRQTADGIQTGEPWHLLFVGSGELGDELREACDVRFDAEGPRNSAAKETGDSRPSGSENQPERSADRLHGNQLIRVRERQESGGRQTAYGGRPEADTADAGSGSASGSMLHAPRSLPPATFAGFLNQSQISKAYAVADVVVLPSEAWETWGLVVNEATAAGAPTVVSDRCGCSEDFAAKNPYTRIFPMGDVAAMAQAIEEVLVLEVQPGEVTKFAEAFSPRVTARAVAERLRGIRHTA